MASRVKRQTSVHDKVWNFNVLDPTLHPNGFTIYKVISRVRFELCFNYRAFIFK